MVVRRRVDSAQPLCPLSLHLPTDVSKGSFLYTAEGFSVYDSNPNESLKRDFQDYAPVTRRNGPARKNLPPNDPKLLTAYKLQSARA